MTRTGHATLEKGPHQAVLRGLSPKFTPEQAADISWEAKGLCSPPYTPSPKEEKPRGPPTSSSQLDLATCCICHLWF